MGIRRITGHLSVLAATGVIAAGLAVVGTSTNATAVSAAGLTPNDGSKSAVAAAYNAQWVPATAVTVSPTGGSNNACTPWATSSTIQASTLKAINFVRWMSGAGPVTFDQTLSDKAARAAQMMVVNNALNHAPPTSWTCYSTAGKDAAGKSNLSSWGGITQTTASLIGRYMTDGGTGNVAAGHRRWILYPKTGVMGSGNARAASDATGANALWVIGNAATSPVAAPDYSGWPTAGYFPRQLEPGGRWSFSSSRSDVSLAGATVSVKNAAGSALGVKQYSQSVGYGLNTIVWDFSTKPPVGTGSEEMAYVVTVSGIKVGGVTRSPYSYTVRLFDPTNVSKVANELTTSPKVSVSTTGTATVNVSCSQACAGYAQLWSDQAGTKTSTNVVRYSLAGAGFQTMAFTGVPNVSATWLTRLHPDDATVVFKPLELVRTEPPVNDLKTSASTTVSSTGKATVNVSCSMACEGYAQLRSDEAGTIKSTVFHYKLSKAGWMPMYFTGVPHISSTTWRTRISASTPTAGVTFKALQLIRG